MRVARRMNNLDIKDAIMNWKEHLPLAVGTVVWFIDSEGKLWETKIAEFVIGDRVRFRLEKNSTYLTALSALGKTVFTSKFDAEAKSRKRNG